MSFSAEIFHAKGKRGERRNYRIMERMRMVKIRQIFITDYEKVYKLRIKTKATRTKTYGEETPHEQNLL